MLRREVGDSTNASWTDVRRMGCSCASRTLLWWRLKIVSPTFYSLPPQCSDSGGSIRAPGFTVTGKLQAVHVLWHAGRHHAQAPQLAQRGPTSTFLSCSFSVGHTLASSCCSLSALDLMAPTVCTQVFCSAAKAAALLVLSGANRARAASGPV